MLDKAHPEIDVSLSLHRQIISNFLFIWENDHSYLINEFPFMMRLPYKLRCKLILSLFSETIERFDIFFRNTA